MKSVKKLIEEGLAAGPNLYTHFASDIKLSSNRKKRIANRRSELKIGDDDHRILKIVIKGILGYKPVIFTLDDRYFQLEQILNAIDEAKKTNKVDKLMTVCERIKKELNASPGRFNNALLTQLEHIDAKINKLESYSQKHKARL